MTWFKVDDGFYDHPKFQDVPNAAVGLWVKAGAWCGRHLTDGLIPASQVKVLKGTSAQVNALISAGIWIHSVTDSGAKAYQFHDWNDMQPTRKEKLKERADATERKRKSRARKSDNQPERENVTRDSHVTGSRDSHESHNYVSQRPDPTRPDPTYSIDRSSQLSYGDHARGDGLAANLNLDDLAAATRRARAAGFSDEAITAGLKIFNSRPEPKGMGLLRVLIEEQDGKLKDLDTKQQAREARRAAIDACPRCDNNGMRPTAAGAARCDHKELQPPFAQGA